MTRSGGGQTVRTHETRALLVRRVDYGESDLVLTFFTEDLGRVSALARGARKSRKRFGGVLEPMHTLSIRFDERPASELVMLREARIERPRPGIVSSLARLEAAGRALGWVRRAVQPRTQEPEIWLALEALLDALSEPKETSAMARLAEFGLQLLTALGWGIDFAQCVRCGKPCPSGAAALVDATRGGLICSACGGARLRLEGAERERLARAGRGELGSLGDSDAAIALELTEQALRVHAGFE